MVERLTGDLNLGLAFAPNPRNPTLHLNLSPLLTARFIGATGGRLSG